MPTRELTDDERADKDEVLERFRSAESSHQQFTTRWEHFYALYRSYRAFRESLTGGSPRDRDTSLRDAQREWGAELFIPYTFTVIETILPRILSNRPKMLFLPRDPDAQENVENVRLLMDEQQERIGYELSLQSTAKSGLMYGLGVRKTGWRTTVKMRRSHAPGVANSWIVKERAPVVTFDGPDSENVDIFDFFWDPYATSMETCEWAIHRTWRSTRYVLERLQTQDWQDCGLEPQDVENMGSLAGYETAHANRRRAAGYDGQGRRSGLLHEVLELSDGERRITLLNREYPVVSGENPAWHGELPFHVFRPTEDPAGSLVGISEIEPMEHLQEEVNTLRSQRRDNATLKLMQTFAFKDGAIDPADLRFGPGLAIPVQGDPRELLTPLTVGDIPNSGYREEEMLKADIERTTGISDPVSGADVGASQTATGVQLVQAAANVRIGLKTRRMELETIKPEAHQWLSLNQQQIVDPVPVRVPQVPAPGELAERQFGHKMIGQGEVRGLFDIEPEGGATAPENVPLNQQTAQLLMQMFGQNPSVDQQKLLMKALSLMGIKMPEAFIVQGPQVPPATLDIAKQLMVEQGFHPDKAQQTLEAALQLATQQQGQQGQGGPQQGAPPESQGGPPAPPKAQGGA
jgi:hypothetical protein